MKKAPKSTLESTIAAYREHCSTTGSTRLYCEDGVYLAHASCLEENDSQVLQSQIALQIHAGALI